MDPYLFEFDVSRRKAEARVAKGGAFPHAFASLVCMRNAALKTNGESLLLASVRGSLDFPIVAKQMSRLFDPCGGAPNKMFWRRQAV